MQLLMEMFEPKRTPSIMLSNWTKKESIMDYVKKGWNT